MGFIYRCWFFIVGWIFAGMLKTCYFSRMKFLLLLLMSLTAFSFPAYAQSGAGHDWFSGDSYYWNTDSKGNTNFHGFDTRTGKYWNATIEPDGDMRGYNTDYSPWSYDSATGYYYNFGTGERCIGKGYVRTCYWGGVVNGRMGKGSR